METKQLMAYSTHRSLKFDSIDHSTLWLKLKLHIKWITQFNIFIIGGKLGRYNHINRMS